MVKPKKKRRSFVITVSRISWLIVSKKAFRVNNPLESRAFSSNNALILPGQDLYRNTLKIYQ